MQPSSRRLARTLAAAALLAAVTALVALPLAAQTKKPREAFVPAAGRVRAATEDVTFSGQVRISAVVVPDAEAKAPPVAEITVDFADVTGTGVTSRTAYIGSGSVTLHRHVRPNETLDIEFPFYPPGQPLAAESALASFQMNNGSSVSKSVTISTNPTH